MSRRIKKLEALGEIFTANKRGACWCSTVLLLFLPRVLKRSHKAVLLLHTTAAVGKATQKYQGALIFAAASTAVRARYKAISPVAPARP